MYNHDEKMEYLYFRVHSCTILWNLGFIISYKNPPRKDEIYDYVLFIKGIFIFIMVTVGGIFFLTKKISYIKLIIE